MHATFLSHLILFQLIIQIIFGEEYKFYSSHHYPILKYRQAILFLLAAVARSRHIYWTTGGGGG
jgi:hypothetical protein